MSWVRARDRNSTKRILIKGCELFDGTGRGYLHDQAVAIEAGRFEAVGPSADFGDGSKYDEVIMATGQFALPGLFNMHAHLTFMYSVGPTIGHAGKSVSDLTVHAVRIAAVMLAQGITTARDMGGHWGIPLDVRRAIESGSILGPRVVACGQPISVTGGHASHLCHEADGPDGFRRAAREQLKRGADFVKVMASHDPWSTQSIEQTRPEPTLDELRAAFDVAHSWGRLAASHAMGSIALDRVLQAGVNIVEHGHYLTDALAARMVKQGVYLTPTLSSYDVQTISPRFERGASWASAHRTLIPGHRSGLQAALAAGVKCLVGTDSVGSYSEEVQLMRQAGVSSVDSILACTRWPAEALGLDNQLGTVEAGKIADLVLLHSDPLSDPIALDEAFLVIKDGVSHSTRELTYSERNANSQNLYDLAHRAAPSRGEPVAVIAE